MKTIKFKIKTRNKVQTYIATSHAEYVRIMIFAMLADDCDPIGKIELYENDVLIDSTDNVETMKDWF